MQVHSSPLQFGAVYLVMDQGEHTMECRKDGSRARVSPVSASKIEYFVISAKVAFWQTPTSPTQKGSFKNLGLVLTNEDVGRLDIDASKLEQLVQFYDLQQPNINFAIPWFGEDTDNFTIEKINNPFAFADRLRAS